MRFALPEHPTSRFSLKLRHALQGDALSLRTPKDYAAQSGVSTAPGSAADRKHPISLRPTHTWAFCTSRRSRPAHGP